MIGPLLTDGNQKTIFHRFYESLLIWAIVILQTQTSCHFPGLYHLQQIAASMKGVVGGGRTYCRLSLLETHLNLKKLSLTRPFFVIIIVLLSSFIAHERKQTDPTLYTSNCQNANRIASGKTRVLMKFYTN